MKSYRNRSLIALGFLLLIVQFSCKKEEGEGGKASIYGSLWVQKYNTYGNDTIGEYPGAYEDVYIIYGDDATYGGKTETNPDGKYEFKYLRPGNYKIYAYSKDSLGDPSIPKFAIIKQVSIGKKKESVDAGTIRIYTYQ